MKKITKSFLIVMLFVAMAIGIVACDKSAKITGIYVDTDETTIYIKHKSDWDPLEFLTVKAKLDNGSEKDIKIDSCTFSGLDVNEVGEQTLVITYGAYECTLDVEVYKYVTGIEVQQWPNNQVDHNGTLDTSNVKICVYYSDLTSDEDVTEGFTISAAPTDEVGRHNVTVTYTDAHNETASCTYEYRVNAVLESLALDPTSYQTKVKWTSGADTYNYSTLKVTANYSDGTSLPVDVADLTFERKVTTNAVNSEDYFIVKYGNKTVQSNSINVYVDYEGLEVTGLPASIEYGTQLDLTNVKANAVFTDGSKVEVDVEGCIDYDFSKLGDTVITLSHEINGVTKTYTHNINVFEQFKGEIVAQPIDATTSKYFVVGDEFDGSRFKYFEVWSKTNKQITDMTAITFVNAGVENSPITKNVTVQYTMEGYDTPFTTIIPVEYVESNDLIPSVTISSVAIDSGIPAKVAHNATLDATKLKVRVNYSNGESVVMDFDEDEMDYSFSSVNVGSQPLTVTYKDITSAPVQVSVMKTLSGVELNKDSIRALFNANSVIDFTGVKLTLKYSTGDVEVDAANYADKSFAMDASKLATAHSYVENLTFTFIPNDCYDNSAKTDTLAVEVYDQVTNLTQEGAAVEVLYNAVDKYSQHNTTMRVYTNYVSNNKEQISLATETTSGYKIDKDVDLSKIGTQNFIISYYTYDSTNGHQKVEGTTLTISVDVKDYIVDYKIEGLSECVLLADGIDESKLCLVPVYAAGTTPATSEYVSKTNFATNYAKEQLTKGEYTLVVTYQDKEYTKSTYVVDYMIKLCEEPEFVSLYSSNSKRENTYNATGSTGVKGFTELGNIYTVGSDNAFKFEPIVNGDFGGDKGIQTTTDYILNADVYKYVDGEYVKLSGSELANYVTFDGTAHTFDFEQAAVGQQFKIVVGLDGYTTNGHEKFEFTFEFKVVEGFNVYTAAELSVLDNSNVISAFNGTKVGTKWNDFKTSHGISNNIQTNAIILHNNINVTKNDIPDIHFFKADEVNSGDKDYDRVVGSLKDSYGVDPNDRMNLQFIYLRTVESGKSFNIEGNYFQINLEEIPLIVRVDNGTAAGEVNISPDNALTTHTAAFGFVGLNASKTAIIDEVVDASYVPGNINVNNVDMYGNAKKTEETIRSGGLTAYKAQYVNFNATNNLTQACYIAYFSRGLDRTNSTLDEANKYDTDGTLKTNIAMKLNKVNAYDSYNSLLYLWGTSKVYIDSSNFIGAGGPVMICDHAQDDRDHGGYTTNVYVDYNLADGDKKSVLESWVAGEEGWFAAYEGAGAAAQQLKALDGLLRAVEGQMSTPLPTILNGTKINLVAVYKSGSVEGMSTAEIKGSFKVYGCNGLDFSDPEVIAARQAAQQSLCVMQSNNALNADGSNNCAFAAPGEGSSLALAENLPALISCQDYMNVYLYNGMAAVLGLG